MEILMGSDGYNVSAAWSMACSELASRGVDPRTLPNATRTRLRLERRLPELLDYIASHNPTEVLVEQTLQSKDGSIRGQADIVLVGARSAVIDYKAGVVIEDDGTLNSALERQVVIYAWLTSDALGLAVHDGALFSLRQGMVTVDVSEPRRRAVIQDALEEMRAFNARVPGAQPARPTPDGCGWCPFVCSCDPAWEALSSGKVDRLGWGASIRGSVSAPVVTASSGVAAVPIEAEIGSVTGSGIITDVPMTVAESLSVNVPISVVGLAIRSNEPIAFAWKEGITRLEIRSDLNLDL